MIRITDTLELDERELSFRFSRSSGPGGQHVNRVETAVELRFDPGASASLPAPVVRRLKTLAANRMTAEGEILIRAETFRSQAQNRDAAIERLCTLIRKAAVPPKRRIKTKATRGSKERRLRTKKSRGETKRLRRPPGE